MPLDQGEQIASPYFFVKFLKFLCERKDEKLPIHTPRSKIMRPTSPAANSSAGNRISMFISLAILQNNFNHYNYERNRNVQHRN